MENEVKLGAGITHTIAVSFPEDLASHGAHLQDFS